MTYFEKQAFGDLERITDQLDTIERDMGGQKQVLDYLQRIAEALENIRILGTNRLDED